MSREYARYRASAAENRRLRALMYLFNGSRSYVETSLKFKSELKNDGRDDILTKDIINTQIHIQRMRFLHEDILNDVI